MTNPGTRAALCAVVLITLLAACGPTTPSGSTPTTPEQPSWATGEPRDIVTGVALGAEEALTAQHPDVTFSAADLDLSRSTPCYGSPADGHTIAWISERWLTIDPQQDTMPFVEELTSDMVADGWAVGHPSIPEDDTVELYRGDYLLTLVGDVAHGEAVVGITATSPCVDSSDE